MISTKINKEQNINNFFEQINDLPVLVENDKGNKYILVPFTENKPYELLMYTYSIIEEFFAKSNQKKSNNSFKNSRGIFKGYISNSDEYAQLKEKEIELENK